MLTVHKVLDSFLINKQTDKCVLSSVQGSPQMGI